MGKSKKIELPEDWEWRVADWQAQEAFIRAARVKAVTAVFRAYESTAVPAFDPPPIELIEDVLARFERAARRAHQKRSEEGAIPASEREDYAQNLKKLFQIVRPKKPAGRPKKWTDEHILQIRGDVYELTCRIDLTRDAIKREVDKCGSVYRELKDKARQRAATKHVRTLLEKLDVPSHVTAAEVCGLLLSRMTSATVAIDLVAKREGVGADAVRVYLPSSTRKESRDTPS